MTVIQTPAAARSDVPRPSSTASSPLRPYRVQGALLTTGALAWVAGHIIGGSVDPSDAALDRIAYGVGSGLFQVGLLALLTVLYRTQALGEGRLARFFLRLEAGLITLAIASTTVDTIGVSDLDKAGWAMLDAFWPFSMLGMFFIGIRIAVAGRWQGVARYWPMVAESWAIVVIPTLGIFGAGVATAVSCVHLTVGYAVLGRIVAAKES